jgi:hypothetical protein
MMASLSHIKNEKNEINVCHNSVKIKNKKLNALKLSEYNNLSFEKLNAMIFVIFNFFFPFHIEYPTFHMDF